MKILGERKTLSFTSKKTVLLIPRKHPLLLWLCRFWIISYLVNNAGFGLIGGIEESSNKEVHESFDI